MDDLHANSKLRPIIDDGEGDIPLWNKEIAKVSLEQRLTDPYESLSNPSFFLPY